MFLKSVTSELSGLHGWIDNCDSEGEVGIEIIHWMWWMKHVPNRREERETARVGTQGPVKKGHRQQQADKCEVLLKVVKSVTATQCDQAAVVAYFPQSENVDDRGSNESRDSPQRSRKGVTLCMHGRIPKSQLRSGMQKRKVQNMMVRTSRK